MKDRKSHWEYIYKTKDLTEVSWYQPKPETSLEFISSLPVRKSAKIIDIGGGDSFLAEYLLEEGFKNITVLDISEEALNKAKNRLGENKKKIKWIVSDILDFSPAETFDVWHDRAAFHFLTSKEHIHSYISTLKKSVKKGGFIIMGTFSEKGPTKCSGIEIKQYSLHELADVFAEDFEILDCKNVDHITPSGNVQNFSFCSFKKIS